MLKDNYLEVIQHIKDSCKKINRDTSEVTLISVSKTKPISMLMEAYEAGARFFGENKVQEIVEKYSQMPKDIEWHMIGHLQRNKVKYIIDKVALIHSVDSVRLAETIEKEAGKQNLIMDILLEVNIAKEESKFGMFCENVVENAKIISQFPHVRIQGLMTIAPFVDNPEDNRTIFKQLRKLSVDIMNKNIDNVNMNIISMGMTNDYQVAIEEGATMVRVGTGIFGKRNYSI